MKTNAFVYSLKVWLTAAFVAPFVQSIIDLIRDHEASLSFGIFYSISTGAIIAIPNLILFWLFLMSIKNISSNNIFLKTCLTLVGIVLLTILLYVGRDIKQYTYGYEFLSIPFVVLVIGAIWLYDLPVLISNRYLKEVNG